MAFIDTQQGFFTLDGTRRYTEKQANAWKDKDYPRWFRKKAKGHASAVSRLPLDGVCAIASGILGLPAYSLAGIGLGIKESITNRNNPSGEKAPRAVAAFKMAGNFPKMALHRLCADVCSTVAPREINKRWDPAKKQCNMVERQKDWAGQVHQHNGAGSHDTRFSDKFGWFFG